MKVRTAEDPAGLLPTAPTGHRPRGACPRSCPRGSSRSCPTGASAAGTPTGTRRPTRRGPPMVPSYPGTAGYPPPPPPGYLVYPGAPAYPAYPGTPAGGYLSSYPGPPPPQLVRHTLHRRTWAWVVVVTAIVAACSGDWSEPLSEPTPNRPSSRSTSPTRACWSDHRTSKRFWPRWSRPSSPSTASPAEVATPSGVTSPNRREAG